MLYLAYFLIRDGDQLLLHIRRAIPLPSDDKSELLTTFTGVVRATVKGNLVVAAVQGALGGLAFWFARDAATVANLPTPIDLALVIASPCHRPPRRADGDPGMQVMSVGCPERTHQNANVLRCRSVHCDF